MSNFVSIFLYVLQEFSVSLSISRLFLNEDQNKLLKECFLKLLFKCWNYLKQTLKSFAATAKNRPLLLQCFPCLIFLRCQLRLCSLLIFANYRTDLSPKETCFTQKINASIIKQFLNNHNNSLDGSLRCCTLGSQK